MALALQRRGEPVNLGASSAVALKRLLRWVVGLVLGLAALSVVTVATVWSLAHGEVFTGWLMRQLPGVTVTAPQGALLGDFHADRIDVVLPRGGRLWLVAPRWQGLHLVADASAQWGLGVRAELIAAERLELQWVGDPASPAAQAPDDLRLPVSVGLASVSVNEAHSALWGEPLREVRLSVHLQDDAHRVQLQSLAWSGWRLGAEGARLSVGAAAPLPLQLLVTAVGEPKVAAADDSGSGTGTGTGSGSALAMPGELRLQASGPLTDVSVQGWARWGALATPRPKASRGSEDGTAQLDLSLRLRPFMSWPVAQARVTARALDLSALGPGTGATATATAASAWPRTRLDGSLSLQPDGPQGLVLDVDLRNAMASAWGQGGVPLLAVKGQAFAPQAQLALQGMAPMEALRRARADLRLALPSGPGRAPGILTVAGEWDGREPVSVVLAGVQPQALHASAPPLLLQGSLRLQPTWHVAALTQVQVDAALTGEFGRAHAQPAQAMSWPAADQPIALNLDAAWRPQGLRVAELRLWSGAQGAASSAAPAQAGSEARLTEASLDAVGAKGWLAQGKVDVQRFDPQVWLPWPQGLDRRNSLSAQGRFRIDQSGQGQADVQLLPSLLAHVPLQGEAHWQAQGKEGARVRLALDVAGNQLRVEGEGSAAAPWAGAWQAQLSAAQLQALTPLAPLLGLKQLQGALQADARWQGIGPGAGSGTGSGAGQGKSLWAWLPRGAQGSFEASDWRLTRPDGRTVSLAAAAGDWRWGGQGSPAGAANAGDATSVASTPVHLQARLQGLRTEGVTVDAVQTSLTGSLGAHQWRVQGDGRFGGLVSAVRPVRPVSPGSTARPVGSGLPASTAAQPQSGAAAPTVAAPEPIRLAVAVDGGWQPQRGGWAWRGRLTQATVVRQAVPQGSGALGAGAQTTAAAPMPDATWLNVQPTDIAWQQGPGGASLTVQATRVQLMGADFNLERLAWRDGASTASAAAAAGGAMAVDRQAVDIALRLAPTHVPQWLARWQPQAGWGGDLTVAGQVRVLRQPGRPWEIDAELARQSGDITLSEPTVEGQSAQRLGLREARISLNVRQGVWTVQQVLDGRVLGRLSGRQTVQARDPMSLPNAQSPLTGELDLQVASLRPLATWAPAGWRLDGQLQGQARIAGTLSAPTWTGWLQGEQIALSQSLLGVQISDGALRIELDGKRARLSRFVATGGPQGGKLVADGEATLGESPRVQLRVQAERFAALQRIDRRMVLSGDTQVQLDADLLQARGRIVVDEGLIDISRTGAPTLGDDVSVRRRPGQTDAEAEEGSDGGKGQRAGKGALQQRIDADLSLDLGQNLRLKGRGLDGMLIGQLRVTTPASKPAIQGVVKLAQGTFAAYGQKLRIERSTITFTGLIDNPRLDILAMRPQAPSAGDSDVRVGVRISGTALDPRIRLYSEPALSETEQLSWLVLGRAPTGLGGADIGLLQTAAVALLSGESREGPTDKFIALLGLDNLSVRQSSGSVRATVVNVGRQVSRHWYVGYERNLNATGGNWQLIYSLAQRFKLRGQAGEDNALDLIMQWRWD